MTDEKPDKRPVGRPPKDTPYPTLTPEREAQIDRETEELVADEKRRRHVVTRGQARALLKLEAMMEVSQGKAFLETLDRFERLTAAPTAKRKPQAEP